MMINDYAEQLYNELLEEIELFNDLGTIPVRRVMGVIKSIRVAFDKLKACLEDNSFPTPEEEIYFFKSVKPKFIAEQIYAMEIFTIEMSRPVGDEDALIAFYKLELKYLERFLYQYRSLYQYFQYEETAFDQLYFIREKEKPFFANTEAIELDTASSFSTGYDYLFGRFIACERLQQYLALKLNHPLPVSLSDPKKMSLSYTGDAIELVELIYGLYLKGSVKNGKATLSELFALFEVMFEIKLGKPSRRWESIERRKRVAVTRFLDELKAAILKRIDDNNAK